MESEFAEFAGLEQKLALLLADYNRLRAENESLKRELGRALDPNRARTARLGAATSPPVRASDGGGIRASPLDRVNTGGPSQASPEAGHSERFELTRIRFTIVAMRATPPKGPADGSRPKSWSNLFGTKLYGNNRE